MGQAHSFTWRNYFNDVAVGSLDPDIRIDYRFTDFIQGVDPVMNSIRESLDANPRDSAKSSGSANQAAGI